MNDQQATDQKYLDISKDLRCPTCTGLSVLDSDAAFSEQIKSQVKKLVSEGKGKQEVLNFFTDRYGPWILRSPPKEGFHLIAWALPLALALLGIILVMVFWKRPNRDFASSATARSKEEILRELKSKLDAKRLRENG